MKALLLSLLLFVFAASLSAEKTSDIEVAVATRDTGVAASQAQHRDRVFQLKKTYTSELARQDHLVRAKGDLEGVLAIRGESERMDRALTPAELKALPEAARANRAKFDQSVARSLAQERAEVAAHDRAYAATLQTVQARLTRAGDIEGALKAKGLLDALKGGKASPVAMTPASQPDVAPQGEKETRSEFTKAPKDAEELKKFLTGTTWTLSHESPDAPPFRTITFNANGTFSVKETKRTTTWTVLSDRAFTLWGNERSEFTPDMKTFAGRGARGKYYGRKK